jgi:hypothetical protein
MDSAIYKRRVTNKKQINRKREKKRLEKMWASLLFWAVFPHVTAIKAAGLAAWGLDVIIDHMCDGVLTYNTGILVYEVYRGGISTEAARLYGAITLILEVLIRTLVPLVALLPTPLMVCGLVGLLMLFCNQLSFGLIGMIYMDDVRDNGDLGVGRRSAYCSLYSHIARSVVLLLRVVVPTWVMMLDRVVAKMNTQL